METTTKMVDEALWYASRGLHVIPVHSFGQDAISGEVGCSCGEPTCASPGKHPIPRSGLKEATTDPEKIKAWWTQYPDANIAIVTGAISGIVVVDLDGQEGKNEWAELVKQHGATPRGWRIKTGGGGRHVYFAHPGGEVRNTAKRIGAHIDSRGDGGYVLAPPSVHASGGQYEFASDDVRDLEFPAMPAWVAKKMATPPAMSKPMGEVKITNVTGDADDAAYWLGKALGRAMVGSRNDTGLWLAAQLRDAGIDQSAALDVMHEYVRRAPAGDTPYTAREAEATLRSAYSRPPREPAKVLSVAETIVSGLPQPVGVDSPRAELMAFMSGVMQGEIFDAGWGDALPRLTGGTNALLPGTVTMIVGDPGVGKTFFVLQGLIHWFANGIEARVLFVEKDRKFHTQRLLAQLENKGDLTRIKWIKENPQAVAAAMERQGPMIDELGKKITSFPSQRLTLDHGLEWIKRQADEGARVLVIDPVSALSGGRDRFVADDDFMIAAQQVCTAYGVSLVLVTHSKKGNRQNDPGMGDMAFGAAYQRFSDTNIWIERVAEPKPVEIVSGTALCPQYDRMLVKIVLHLQKTRLGDGAGWRVALDFGTGGRLTFRELGRINRVLKGAEAAAFDEAHNY